MTAQMPEVLILDGEEVSITCCPRVPKKHPRIVEIDITNPDERRGPGILYSTACWRRYQGTWEIKDGLFFLVGLRGRFRLLGEEPLLADWFSGTLRIPRGKRLLYVHMGFGSVYEQEIHIKIRKGKVGKSRTIDNRGKEHNRVALALKNLPWPWKRESG